ncbi:fatty acid CoA ligase family protein [Desulfopila aestuarii]|uniref:Acyl-CoA synthetase (AMP-forming)/AMP-acid ligase II n=1 Tax=Desulfopila aestuarii DSM 18488 TaxID=1121416 RepID=A0A1M7Y200_9BACT|nr:fatty acid CoA ligase family protein [Desulfopila aestuarii]SHO45911.1 Acyl-CoA synthetase (AMP-forming)/AMP-acid ligase II [Desulfopila aestuarii DSM 18488]
MVKNIAQTFNRVAGLQGDKTAVIEAKTGKSVTFAELNSRSDGYAAMLKGRGVKPGDKVMLMVTPSADFICLTFALFKVGVTIILIDPGMGYKNLLRCIEGVAPTVFIGIPKARIFAAIFRRTFQSIRIWFCCGNTFGLFGPDIRKVIDNNPSSFPVYSPGDDDLAAIIFTTGSTGPPKGVRYEHSIFAAQLERIRDFYGIDHEHIDQPAFPLFALFSASLGACSVIPDMDPTRPAKVDPQKFINSIEKYRVTYSFGSPAIWNVVSRYCIKENIKLQSLSKVLMAGAPVPGELLERVRSILPDDAQIFTPYGATESLPIVSMEATEILNATWAETRQGKGVCVGRPLPGIDICIMTIDEGPVAVLNADSLLPVGEIGEILVRGDVVTRAYENNEKETKHAKVFDPDGKSFWHRMGDTGFLDQEGRLWFCGRKAHRVVTSHGTLYTICCEAIVNEHPQVYRSALVGIQNSGSKDLSPVLIVEPVKEYRGSQGELLAEVASLTAASPVTAEITTFLVHPDFPVDIRHNAKIFREKLAIWAAEQLRKTT